MKKLLLVPAALALLNGCMHTSESSSNLVYISSGAVQCEHHGKSVQQTARLLTEKAIVVSESQCGQLTEMAVIAMCGAATTDINLHRIASQDLAAAKALGFNDVKTLKQTDNLGYIITDCK